jgi:hypothetical protein
MVGRKDSQVKVFFKAQTHERHPWGVLWVRLIKDLKQMMSDCYNYHGQ